MSETLVPFGYLCPRVPGAWKYYVTGVTTAWMQEVGQRMEQLPSEYPKGHKCSQQSSNLKGDGYIRKRAVDHYIAWHTITNFSLQEMPHCLLSPYCPARVRGTLFYQISRNTPPIA